MVAPPIWMRAYLALAAASLALAILWQSLALPGAAVQTLPIYFYQHAIGSLDGRNCPSYPVCSDYANQAMQHYGLWLGSWLALDRLIHEGDDLQHGPRLIVDGVLRLHDPLERNAFWLNMR